MIVYTSLYPIRMRSGPIVTDDNILTVVPAGANLYGLQERYYNWRKVVAPGMDGGWRCGWCALMYEGQALLHEWGATRLYGSPVGSRQPITQLFGENPGRYTQWGYQGHNGIDLGTPVGTPVLAIDDGVVAHARFDAAGYGYYVRLDCVDGGIAVFAHLDRLLVYEGQRVQRGQMVGISGNSGFSDAPHLHIDLRVRPINEGNGYGGRIDPLPYLDRTFLAWPVYLPADTMPWAALEMA
jgi:murein DD-endopeptidase MepM/ murein hydrolase activator NlpD